MSALLDMDFKEVTLTKENLKDWHNKMVNDAENMYLEQFSSLTRELFNVLCARNIIDSVQYAYKYREVNLKDILMYLERGR